MAQVALVGARALTFATMLPAAGLPLYSLVSHERPAARGGPRRATMLLALLAALASVWWVLEDVAAMAGLPLAELDRATVDAVLLATPLGLVMIVRLAALAALGLGTLAGWPVALPALAGVVALGTAAFTGHAGATEGGLGLLHRLADGVHLAAAACWIAALIRFLADARARPAAPALAQRLSAFARVGSVLVALLVLTGVANSLLIAGYPPLLTARWTLVLAAKLGLFAVMLGLAALNRWKLAPALPGGGRPAQAALCRALSVELLAGLAILALVALLGTLDPTG